MDPDKAIPFPAQLALAIAIVKQKPADLNAREYILQIRKYIKDTKDADKSYTQDKDKFFDSVSFWQQAYEKSEAEQSKLLDRIYDLERRNEALTAKLQARDSTFGEESTSSKRKAAAGKKTAAARKRAKTQMPGPLSNGVSGHGLALYDEMVSLEYVEESTGPFMRHFYTLQRALQKRSNGLYIVRAAGNLCKTTVDDVSKTISEKRATPAVSKKKGSAQIEKPGIVEVLRSVGCAFQLLLRAIKALSGTEHGMQHINHVVYHIACLYKSTMKGLEQWCKTKSEQLILTQPAKQKQAASRKSAKSVQLRGTKANIEDEASTQIAQLLHTMAVSLDLGSPRHQDLLESFLFILLNRVGKLLCLFVFQDLKLRPDLSTDSTKLPLPKGLTNIELNDKSLLAAEMEAKCLIWLLERTLTALRNFAPSPPSSTSGDNDECVLFVANVKKKLQNTLLQAVFGEDTAWGQSLQRSPQTDDELDYLQSSLQIPDQLVPDWFTQEVWRLLGWDMLVNNKPSER
ncbi:hypothetical protein BDV28DRAFT_150815 [Aspergillus coremiiformis]|uniref:Uncharacterized protein n=1 Tax=Aspergillus coremiiformis TaxID=138285 RepID=A0A5N6Z069_9EURO|nr:hypothetical protein BDV28DRAFT_150815 [Aspergillus coremiiformis]